MWEAGPLVLVVLAVAVLSSALRRVHEAFQLCRKPKYQPGLWNDDPLVKKNNNCNAYAFGIRRRSGGKLQPGALSGLPPLKESEYSCPAFADRVRRDHPEARDADPDAPCPCDTYKVALFLDNAGANMDYHFLAENEGGMWSHKPGTNDATDLDASGRRISDPRKADLDFSMGIGQDPYNYTHFCGAWCVPYREAP